MKILQLLKYSFLVMLLPLLSACGGGECHDCDPEDWAFTRNFESRALDISGAVEVTTVEAYFSLYEFGPTAKIYHFTDKQAVFIVSIDNSSPEFEANLDAKVHLFERGTLKENIDRWINNQHSDGIVADAAMTTELINLPQSVLSVNSSTLMENHVELSGNEYDNYSVELYIDNYEINNTLTRNISIFNFIIEANVHVLTKDIYAVDNEGNNSSGI